MTSPFNEANKPEERRGIKFGFHQGVLWLVVCATAASADVLMSTVNSVALGFVTHSYVLSCPV